MFFRHKKQGAEKKEVIGKIFAAQSGTVIPITQVHDEVFAQKVLGDGVAIKPETGTVVSPVTGEVVTVAETLHAYGIKTPDGLEVLVHIGVNTVELNGEGFQGMVKLGDNIKVGTPLCEVNLDLLKKKGYDTDIVIIVTNLKPETLTAHTGIKAEAGQTCVLEYHL